MKRGPRMGIVSSTDFVEKARAAWGAPLHDWIEALAKEANRSSGVRVARKLGYSPAVVSQVLGNRYPGDIGRVEEKVRGALMGATVKCPILGVIGRNRCLDEQKKPFAGTSSIRSKLYHACRSGCPHWRIGPKE